MTNPISRRNDIIAEKLAAETILYDKSCHRAHSLNQTLALVWESADGQNSIDDLAAILHRDLGIPADRDLVLLALQQLSRAGLLQQSLPTAAGPELLTRRQVARRLALAGTSAAMLPLVASVLAPTPAMASSGITQSQATNDLNTIENEAQTDPAYYNGPNAQTAKADLLKAQAAWNSGNYNAEVQDLDGVVNALGLPPL
jgi:Coenzyme PQQ synthesis protein D (PqqD)